MNSHANQYFVIRKVKKGEWKAESKHDSYKAAKASLPYPQEKGTAIVSYGPFEFLTQKGVIPKGASTIA